MKRIINIISLSFIFLLFLSCRKDWNCSCEGKAAGNDIGNEFDITDVKKEEAETICAEDEFNYDDDNYSECEIK